MTTQDLVGLRDSDLSARERAERDALLGSDVGARRDQGFAEELGDLLGTPLEGGPTLEAIRDRPPAASTGRWAVGAGVLLAASALIWVALPGEALVRDRGVGAGPVGVRLAAVAEGPDGVRPLASGARVGADEKVGFWVDASGTGALTLVEDDGRAVYPGSGQTWRASKGEQVLGGAAPLAYRPDESGPHSYTVELCEGGRCAKDRLVLEWASR